MIDNYLKRLPRPGSKVVLLLSGGMDSAALAALLKNKGCEVFPLHIHYGQRAFEAERIAIGRVVSMLGLHDVRCLDISGIGKMLGSAIVADSRHGGHGEMGGSSTGRHGGFAVDYLPHRNALLVSLAAALAADMGAGHVALGIIGGAENKYPDTSASFLGKLKRLFKTAPGISICAPFTGMSKRNVAKIARLNGLEIASTFSCNARSDRHCGRCPSCIERKSVMAR